MSDFIRVSIQIVRAGPWHYKSEKENTHGVAMTYVKIKQEFAVAFFSVSPACKWTWAHMTISLSKVYHMTFVPRTTPFGGCFWLLDHLYLSCFSFHPGFHQTNWRKIHPEFLARQISGFDFVFLNTKSQAEFRPETFSKNPRW